MAPLDKQLLLASYLASETTPNLAETKGPPAASPTAPSPKMASVPPEAREQCNPHITWNPAPSADAKDARRDHPHRCRPPATWQSVRWLERPSLSFNLGCWKNRSSLTEPTWLSTNWLFKKSSAGSIFPIHRELNGKSNWIYGVDSWWSRGR